MADKIKALVQQAHLFYRLSYREPIFNLDILDDKAVSAVYAAFREWNIALENVNFKDNPTNVAEEATNFNLLGGRIIFSITAGGCGVVVTNPNWSELELVRKIAGAGIKAVIGATGAEADKQGTTLTLHLKPQSGAIKDITSRFVRFELAEHRDAPITSFGFSVYSDERMWVVDKSAAFPDSLFVRMDRTFRADVSLEQVAGQLIEDENKLLDTLGLEVE